MASPLGASSPKASANTKVEQDLSKQDGIRAACRKKDYDTLRQLASSPGGFQDDSIRRVAWPILLGCDAQPTHSNDWHTLPTHKDEDQVALDVDRSFVYYPKDDSEKRIEVRKEQLSGVIIDVLRRHPLLNYFQGYHDIAQVFLLVLGPHAAAPAMERLSLLRIRDFMTPTMTGALSHLTILPAILSAADPLLYRHLAQTAPFYFALPATLTLYAHDIQEYGDIARLFDYLLTNEAVISIYLFVIVICSRKEQLLELEATEHDMLHATLSKLPKPLNLDSLITQTDALYQRYPPEKLGVAWYRISRSSVMKTARQPAQIVRQTLEQGETWLDAQAREIQRQDARRATLDQARNFAVKNRRPALVLGSSILVVALSLYLARQGTSSAPLRLARAIAEWGGLR